MSTVAYRRTPARFRLSPETAGIRLAPREFDGADFVDGWRYELIDGVLVVSPMPLENELDPNEELGRWLRNYHEGHRQGFALDATLFEHTIRIGNNRRRPDRVIWTGLGRLPKKGEVPSIIVEFVTAGKRAWLRDYEEKRDKYLEAGVKEYWVVNRFDKTMTVFAPRGTKVVKRIIKEKETYATSLLPGFELPLGQLLRFANRWPTSESDDL